MNVPQINEVKESLDRLQKDGLIAAWELPYENILTRLNAAIFFLTPLSSVQPETIWSSLEKFENFSSRANTEKKLSLLDFRITFNSEELQKNLQPREAVADSPKN